MSLFVRKNEESTVAPSVSVVAPVRQVERVEDPKCDYLGRGSRIQGKLRFEGSVQIAGVVEGEIDATEGVVVERGAEVSARITASTVLVHGTVDADIHARGRLEVGATGVIRGKVTTAALVVHEGAVFEGSCTMGEPREAMRIAASA
jgi:cytoskeletal protein CcmA (bactofilin family)